MYHKAFKYRLYPTTEQQRYIRKACGQSRFLFNWGLAIKKDAYESEKRKIAYKDLDKMYREMRNNDPEKVWLREVNSRIHEYALRNLDTAFRNFFRGFGYPKFKSKYDYRRTAQSDADTGRCKINFKAGQNWRTTRKEMPTTYVKMGTVDFGTACKGIPVVIDKEFYGTPKMFTFEITASGKYFVSILVEYEGELPAKAPILEETTIGLDVNIVNLAYTSNAEITDNPQYYERELKRLARYQRELSRRAKGGKNRTKSRLKVAKLHEKIANRRKDHAHKLSHDLLVRYDTIVLEDLDIKAMVQNPYLARQIYDCGWGNLGIMLEYKANWRGKNVIRVDQYYASTKICNACGGYNETVKLKNRMWTCEHCETVNEVDFNASLNLKTEGLRIANEVALIE